MSQMEVELQSAESLVAEETERLTLAYVPVIRCPPPSPPPPAIPARAHVPGFACAGAGLGLDGVRRAWGGESRRGCRRAGRRRS